MKNVIKFILVLLAISAAIVAIILLIERIKGNSDEGDNEEGEDVPIWSKKSEREDKPRHHYTKLILPQ